MSMPEIGPEQPEEEAQALDRTVLAERLQAEGVPLSADNFRMYDDADLAEFVEWLGERYGFDADEVLKAAWHGGDDEV
jgi:hypothetical protein